MPNSSHVVSPPSASQPAPQVLRSLLFAPANHARHAQSALNGAADGVILDLEDAVAVGEKPTARLAARELLASRAADDAGNGAAHTSQRYPIRYVRINGLTTPYAYADLLAVVGPGLDGVVLPKAESAAQIATLDWLLTQLERERGLAPGATEIAPIIETAAGLAALPAIAAASPRVRRLNFGAGDFSLDTRMTWTPNHPGLLWARASIVIASRAAGLAAPIDTVFADLGNDDGLLAETTLARELGFAGKACIHPRQVTIVHSVFTPTADEIADAHAIVSAFAEAEAQGIASMRVGDRFVDYPVAARARQTLDLAAHVQHRGEPT